MKSRETLIRLKKFQVDEKRRKVMQIEGMIAEFDRMAADLDREILAEQERAGIHDPAHFAYPTYAKAAMQRRENLKRSADELKVQVGQDDMTERLVLQSRQYGVEPQQLLQFLQENNQLPAMFADVRRGKALAVVVNGATVKDTAGNTIDTAEFFGPRQEAAGADSDAAETAVEEAEESDEDDSQ